MVPTAEPAQPSPLSDFDGLEVLVGVCGGIAAYKVAQVVSTLVQRGAGVTVAMTHAARKFVGQVTFQALSGRRVLTHLWHEHDTTDVQHIAMSGRADVVLLAPATANILGKINAGIADDMVTTLVISTDAPVLLAPSMNDRMWANSIVQRNVQSLRDAGYFVVEPGEGWLACRSVGAGRMAEPEDIVQAMQGILSDRTEQKAKC